MPQISSHGDSSRVDRPMGLRVALRWLLFSFVPAVIIASAISYQWHGREGLLAVGIAGGVCWLAGAVALVVTAISTWANNPVAGVLAGTLIRMVFPLAACMACGAYAPELMQAGFALTCICFYLFMLTVETLLALRVVVVNAEKPKAVEV